jgi:hypothetical protein
MDFILLEYLTYLALASVLGLVLFAAAVLILVTRKGARKLWEQAAARIPQLAARLSMRQALAYRDAGPQRPAHSH